jgi:hypothetical protein
MNRFILKAAVYERAEKSVLFKIHVEFCWLDALWLLK